MKETWVESKFMWSWERTVDNIWDASIFLLFPIDGEFGWKMFWITMDNYYHN